MPAKNAAQIIVREFAVTWNAISVGWVMGVDLSGLKPKLLEKKIEEIGDNTIDHVVVGHEGTVKTTLKQVKLATYQQLLLAGTTTGASPLIPSTQYTSLYGLAKVLNFHPTDMASDVTEDFNFVKATPIVVLPKSSQGKEFMTIDVEWQIYLDQTQLLASPPTLVLGYVGAIPS